MYSIITIILYVKANIYKPDLFSNYSSNLVCMLQGVSKFYINLVIRHPLACSQFYVSVVDVYTTKSTVCSKLTVRNFLPPVCSPLGPECLDKMKTNFKVRKHSCKRAQKLKMALVNIGGAEILCEKMVICS